MDSNTLYSFVSTGHIALWILVLGLFFPRLTLLIAWFLGGCYPSNILPEVVNFIAWLFVPRFLMAYYVYTDQGINNLWVWAYLIIGLVGLFGESNYLHRRIIRRTTVTRDGVTTTTTEENI